MKTRKIFITIYLFVVIVSLTFSLVYASSESGLGKGFDYSVIPTDGESVFTSQTNRIWNSVVIVVRILAFIGIFLVGIRYMLASAEKKADIKKSSILLVIGIILVFASTLFINFIIDTFNQLK